MRVIRKRKINEKKKKNRIWEKATKGEMKGHGYWPFLTAQLSLFSPSLSFSMGIFLAKGERGIESHEIFVPNITENKETKPHLKMVFPFEFPR